MSILNEVEANLEKTIKAAVMKAELAEESEIPQIVLENPKVKSHGDFATNIAMRLAKVAKKAPRQIAEEIVQNLDKEAGAIESVDIAGPGFINFFMQNTYLESVVESVLEAGADYGKSTSGEGKRIQVEFVSVNPTGDLHLGHARGAAFGDILCNVYETAGYNVEREYYINDAGNQMNQLALSVEARYLEALGKEGNMPEDGYKGEDIIEVGKELAEKFDEQLIGKATEERLKFFRDYGLDFEINKIKEDLDLFGVHFDHWFSEQSLYESGEILETLKILKDAGYTYEYEGATWLRSTDFDDDKDRVLIKQDGTYTYLTPDIAYHQNKLDRGFDKIINVWGADHHGYVSRMGAAIQALGYPIEKFSVNIIQMVNLMENGETIRMSKRTGKAVALRELIDEVGVDAVRYFFSMRSNDSQLDFDLDLARSESNENPVFYVQYAHARIATILSNAKAEGYDLGASYDAKLLVTDKELDLLKQLGAFPVVVADAAKLETPHRVTQYVYDLAAMLHSFYNAEKVLGDDKVLTQSRLALIQAVKITIANALEILGVSAPEKM